jgi:hypothetical protein
MSTPTTPTTPIITDQNDNIISGGTAATVATANKNAAVGAKKQMSKQEQALEANADNLRQYEDVLKKLQDPTINDKNNANNANKKVMLKMMAKNLEKKLRAAGISNPKNHIDPEVAGGIYALNQGMSNIAKGKQHDGKERNAVLTNKMEAKEGGPGMTTPGQQGGGEGGGASEYNPYPPTLGKLGETIASAATGGQNIDPAAAGADAMADLNTKQAGQLNEGADELRDQKENPYAVASDTAKVNSNNENAANVENLGAAAGSAAALARSAKPTDVAAVAADVKNRNLDVTKEAITTETQATTAEMEGQRNKTYADELEGQTQDIEEQNKNSATVSEAPPTEETVPQTETHEATPEETVPAAVKTEETPEVTPEEEQAANARAKNAAGGLPNQDQYQKQFVDAYVATLEGVKATGKEDTVGSPWAKLATQVNELPEVKANPKLRVGMSIYSAAAGENVGQYGKNGEFLGNKTDSDVRVKHIKGIISDLKLKKNIQRTKQLVSCMSRRF